jgi:hypothetical protein
VAIASFALDSFAGGNVQINVTMTPAGSFVAESSKVEGSAHKTGNGVIAENILVDVNSLTSHINLRDKHMKARLNAEKFKYAKLIKATGSGGRGQALVEIKGIKKQVSGTYQIAGNMLKAHFPIHLSDFEIKDVAFKGIGVKDEVTIHVNVPITAGAVTRSTASKRK